MLTAFFLLVAIALALSIACLIWPKPALGPVALVLICIALLLLSQSKVHSTSAVERSLPVPAVTG